jgi:hypothetical protein
MNLRQVVMTGVAGILLTGLSLTASQAQFASFTSNSSTMFTFTNTGAASHLVSGTGTVQAATNIDFFFKENAGTAYLKNQDIKATLLFSATVAAPAAQAAGFDKQQFTNISLSIQDAQHDNLLTITNSLGGHSTGALIGADKKKTAFLNGGASDGITYTSKYFTFAHSSTDSYSLTMTLFNALGINADHYLNNFSASSFGQFAATQFTPVPEASTLLGFGMLMGGGLLGLRRRKTA